MIDPKKDGVSEMSDESAEIAELEKDLTTDGGGLDGEDEDEDEDEDDALDE